MRNNNNIFMRMVLLVSDKRFPGTLFNVLIPLAPRDGAVVCIEGTVFFCSLIAQHTFCLAMVSLTEALFIEDFRTSCLGNNLCCFAGPAEVRRDNKIDAMGSEFFRELTCLFSSRLIEGSIWASYHPTLFISIRLPM